MFDKKKLLNETGCVAWGMCLDMLHTSSEIVRIGIGNALHLIIRQNSLFGPVVNAKLVFHLSDGR